MKTPPRVVVDTHIVLDWWVFGNPDCASLLEAVSGRRLQWIATAAMREELIHVLARRDLGAQWSSTGWDSLRPHWTGHVQEMEAPTACPAVWPRCTDTDDQKFIDLALAQQARWLISRDRAVLKVAGRCRKLGLSVIHPTAWLAQWRAGTAAHSGGNDGIPAQIPPASPTP